MEYDLNEFVKKVIEDTVTDKLKGVNKKIRDNIEKNIQEEILTKFSSARTIEFKIGEGDAKRSEGLHHKSFDEIMKYVQCNISMILVGPAGSGKTHIAVQCAELLGRDHYSISVNEHTSKTDFLGYMDAHGKIVKTNFRTAYENGGVFIIDEIDCANPNILTIINSALSNGFCPFPDGMIPRNEDFMCICTANTFGEGESMQYIGRNILDAATRDRFATIFVNYDTEIEKILNDSKVYELCQELRKYFASNKLDFIISTRGMLRLSTLTRLEGYKITIDDIKNCLNLRNLSVNIDPILKKYI